MTGLTEREIRILKEMVRKYKKREKRRAQLKEGEEANEARLDEEAVRTFGINKEKVSCMGMAYSRKRYEDMSRGKRERIKKRLLERMRKRKRKR